MPSTMILVQMQIGLKCEVIMAVLDLDVHVAQKCLVHLVWSILLRCIKETLNGAQNIVNHQIHALTFSIQNQSRQKSQFLLFMECYKKWIQTISFRDNLYLMQSIFENKLFCYYVKIEINRIDNINISKISIIYCN